MMRLNKLRALLIKNIDSANITIPIPESDTTIRVELLKWPLQEEPGVSVMIKNMHLNIGGELGLLEVVH